MTIASSSDRAEGFTIDVIRGSSFVSISFLVPRKTIPLCRCSLLYRSNRPRSDYRPPAGLLARLEYGDPLYLAAIEEKPDRMKREFCGPMCPMAVAAVLGVTAGDRIGSHAQTPGDRTGIGPAVGYDATYDSRVAEIMAASWKGGHL
jgi:hypothetical protein